MKKFGKFLAYMLVMLALIIFFSPKVNAYYKLESFLKDKHVFLFDEEVKDSGFSLDLYNAKVYMDELLLAQAGFASVSVWLFYNNFSVEEIKLNEGFSAFLPERIERLTVEHVFYNPTKVSLNGESGGSTFNGEIDLLKRLIVIHLRLDKYAKKKFATSLKQLKKEEGGYIYEYKF